MCPFQTEESERRGLVLTPGDTLTVKWIGIDGGSRVEEVIVQHKQKRGGFLYGVALGLCITAIALITLGVMR